MNMISTMRQRVQQNGKAEITAAEYDQLQSEWITKTGAEDMVLAEREACAKVCDEAAANLRDGHVFNTTPRWCAATIRERSNVEVTGLRGFSRRSG